MTTIEQEKANLIAECNICSEQLFLCWGHSGIPYWKHNRDTCIDIYPHTNEMADMAKQVLFSHLESGGDLKMETNCKQCNRTMKESFSKKITLKKDYTYTDLEHSFTFDIVALNSEGNIIYAIALWKLHPDYENIKTFNKPNFFLVDDTEILDKLDTGFAESITLFNHIVRNSCIRSFCVPTRDLAILMGYLQESRKEIQTFTSPFTKLMKKVEDTLTIKNQGNIVEGSVSTTSQNIFRQIANVISVNPFKSLAIVDDTVNTKADTFDNWNYEGSGSDIIIKKKLHKIWLAFLERKVCLKCNIFLPEVQHGKPFCFFCYSSSNREHLLELQAQ